MYFKIKNILLINAVFLIASFSNCRGQVNNRLYLRECVKSQTDKYFQDIYGQSGQDVYTMVDSIENHLQYIGVLKGVDKDEYLKLIENISEGDSSVINGDKVVKEYSTISALLVDKVVAFCPYKVIVERENDLGSSLVNQFKRSQSLLATGYEITLIKEYLNNIHPKDFINIEYRTPVMIMLLFHVENNIRRE